jgi:uncharacterized cupin superfamily protein
MEVWPGVFVSQVSTTDWRPDPDVPGTEMHELMDADGTSAGLTRLTTVDSRIEWTPPQRETIHILEGTVRIEIAGGPALELKAGDVASLPAGIDTTWHVATPFKEFWVLS